jgi:hypothetical protein
MMRRSMFAAALTAVVALAAATGAGAANAPSPSYQVAGIAFGAPQGTTTSLVGTATGSTGDRAFWRASLVTEPLSGCSTVGSTCAVTGGTLVLNSRNGSQVTGSFDNGSVTLTAQAPGCGTQQFAVNADIGTADNEMNLSAVVTQYRLSFRGTCFALGASVQGSLTVFNVA